MASGFLNLRLSDSSSVRKFSINSNVHTNEISVPLATQYRTNSNRIFQATPLATIYRTDMTNALSLMLSNAGPGGFAHARVASPMSGWLRQGAVIKMKWMVLTWEFADAIDRKD